jgi:hypothetical protein
MIARQIVFLSLVAITIGVILWRAGRRTLAKGKLSEATIVKNVFYPNELTLIQNELGIDDDESGTYYPVIEFMTEKNELITKQLSIGFNPPKSVGSKFSVIYNPSDPSDPSDIVTYPRIQLEVIPKLLMAIGVTGLVVVVLDVYEIFNIIPN